MSTQNDKRVTGPGSRSNENTRQDEMNMDRTAQAGLEGAFGAANDVDAARAALRQDAERAFTSATTGGDGSSQDSGQTMPMMNGMDEKFAYAVGDIYDAEQRILQAQGQMLQQAYNPELKQMLQMHIGQTEQQIQNLEQVCQMIGIQPGQVQATAAQALIDQAQQLMRQTAHNRAVLDTVIADAQAKIEHMEMACYRTLVMGAQAMNQQEITQMLQQNLQQEEQMAQRVEQSAPLLIQEALGHDMDMRSAGA